MSLPPSPMASMVRRQWAITASGQTISTVVPRWPRIACQAVMVLPRPTSSARRKPGRLAATAAAMARTASSWWARSRMAPVGGVGAGGGPPSSSRWTRRSHE
jgi:hypothetical protein